jgi:hypothetical protein
MNISVKTTGDRVLISVDKIFLFFLLKITHILYNLYSFKIHRVIKWYKSLYFKGCRGYSQIHSPY